MLKHSAYVFCVRDISASMHVYLQKTGPLFSSSYMDITQRPEHNYMNTVAEDAEVLAVPQHCRKYAIGCSTD